MRNTNTNKHPNKGTTQYKSEKANIHFSQKGFCVANLKRSTGANPPSDCMNKTGTSFNPASNP